MEEKLRRPRPPIRTPMFDEHGNLTRPWVVFFEEVHGKDWMLPGAEVTKVELAPVDLDPHTPGNQNPGYTVWQNSYRQAVGVQLRVTPPKDERFARVALYVDRATGRLEPVGEYDYPSNLTLPAPFNLPAVWFDRPETNQIWKFAVATITVTGVRTEPSTHPAREGKTWIKVNITKIERFGFPTITAPPTIHGDLWESSGLPALNISIPYQAPTTGMFTGITVYLKRPQDEKFKALFFHLHEGGPDGQNGTVQWYYDRPKEDEVWEVILSPRTHWYGEKLVLHPDVSNPPNAVDHNYCRFTAPAVGPASATGITDAQVGEISYGQTQDGMAYWGLTYIRWTNPSNDVNFYFSRLTVQKVNASGQPAPDFEGVERVVYEQQWRGYQINIPVDYWSLPAADAPYRRFRFRLYCVNWKRQATLQTQAWNGQPYADVEPEAQGTRHRPVSDIGSLALTPTAELDPIMNGQNPYYTIDHHGIETVGVQLKVTPPNDSNWLRAGIWLDRNQGDDLEPVAEYPYSGTVPQPYNLEPIWRPRPKTDQTWRFVSASVGKNGARTVPDRNKQGTYLDVWITKVVGIGYPTITTVLVHGDQWETGGAAVKITFNYTAPSSGAFTGVTLFRRRLGEPDFVSVAFYPHEGGANGQNDSIIVYFDRPASNENWEFILSPRTQWHGEALFRHEDDRNYRQVTIPAIGSCSPTGITNAQVGEISYGQTQDGMAYWGLTYVRWTNPNNDANFYFSRLTVQKVNASGQPAPDFEGVERVVYEQQWPGYEINIPVDYWSLPAADAPYRRFRFRLYCVSWNRTATLQTQAWSGQSYVDVEPQAQATPYRRVADVTSVALTPTAELDPMMNGQNPYYTIDAQGLEMVVVQLKVTPPNDSNWLRAAMWLDRNAGDDLEPIAEYPYSGTVPQPYNLEPIWRKRPDADQTWRFVASSIGVNGARTLPDRTKAGTYVDVPITKVAGIGYPTITTVTVLGDQWETGGAAVKITFNYTAPSSGAFTGITLFRRRPNEPDFISVAFYPHEGGANGQNDSIIVYFDRPTSDEAWEFVLSPRTQWHGEALFRHPDDRNYRQLTITAVGACSPTGITNVQVGSLTYGRTHEYTPYWGLEYIQWTNPSNDVNFFFSRLTVQRVDQWGTPAPGADGKEQVVHEQQWAGYYINLPINYWELPPSDSPYKRFRFRLYCINWNRQATLQTQAWPGQPPAAYYDVQPGQQSNDVQLVNGQNLIVRPGMIVTTAVHVLTASGGKGWEIKSGIPHEITHVDGQGSIRAGYYYCEKSYYHVNTEIVDQFRNANFNSLKISDQTVITPGRNADVNSLFINATQRISSTGVGDFAEVKVGGANKIGSLGQFFPRYFSSSSRPTLSDGEVALWWDSSTNRMYWLARIGSNYFRVEMNITS